MPKTFTSDMQGLSVRFPIEVMAWFKHHAEAKGEPVTEFLRRIVDDFRTLFGLPRSMVESLEADAAAMKMDRREYLMHLITLRYQQILAHGPGFEKHGGGKSGKR